MLDAVRACAMLLGVVLHACVAYMHAPPRDLLWPIQEPSASRGPDIVFWTIHLFRVPLFFFAAGILAAQSISRHGADAFVRSRWKRVGLPFLVACITVLPAMYPIWVWGWVTRGWAAWEHMPHMRFGPAIQHNFLGPAHLWFLEYLFIDCVALWVLVRWLPHLRLSRPAALGALALLVLVSMTALARCPATLLGFRNSFLPDPAGFIFHTAFFAAGVVIFPPCGALNPSTAHRPHARTLLTWTIVILGTLVMLLVASSFSRWTIQTHDGPRQGLPNTRAAALWLAAIAGACAWIFPAMLTLSGTHTPRTNTFAIATKRYLADASYWVYLTHLPWVGLLVMLLQGTALRSESKAVIVAAGALLASLCTFALVRRTAVGRWLGAKG